MSCTVPKIKPYFLCFWDIYNYLNGDCSLETDCKLFLLFCSFAFFWSHSLKTFFCYTSTRSQFHQCFTSSFIVAKSQKRKKTMMDLTVFLALLGSLHVKAAHKHVGEIDPTTGGGGAGFRVTSLAKSYLFIWRKNQHSKTKKKIWRLKTKTTKIFISLFLFPHILWNALKSFAIKTFLVNSKFGEKSLEFGLLSLCFYN